MAFGKDCGHWKNGTHVGFLFFITDTVIPVIKHAITLITKDISRIKIQPIPCCLSVAGSFVNEKLLGNITCVRIENARS